MTHVNSGSTWAQRLGEQLGRNVQRARQTALEPLTAQQVADRCTVIGHPMTRSVVTSIESGRKVPAVPDLLAIAAAIGVAPSWLMAPAGAPWAEAVEALPSVWTDPSGAFDWMSGQSLLDFQSDSDPSLTRPLTDEWLRRRNGAYLTGEHRRWARHWGRFQASGGLPPKLERLGMLRRSMRVSGVPVPELPEGIPDDPGSDLDLDHHDDLTEG